MGAFSQLFSRYPRVEHGDLCVRGTYIPRNPYAATNIRRLFIVLTISCATSSDNSFDLPLPIDMENMTETRATPFAVDSFRPQRTDELQAAYNSWRDAEASSRFEAGLQVRREARAKAGPLYTSGSSNHRVADSVDAGDSQVETPRSLDECRRLRTVFFLAVGTCEGCREVHEVSPPDRFIVRWLILPVPTPCPRPLRGRVSRWQNAQACPGHHAPLRDRPARHGTTAA